VQVEEQEERRTFHVFVYSDMSPIWCVPSASVGIFVDCGLASKREIWEELAEEGGLTVVSLYHVEVREAGAFRVGQ
jgi:hypothetical protein